MPQAGLHGIFGTVCRRCFPHREWLWLGVVLGNLVPDLDNIAVAVAVLTKSPTEGLHRTWSHSLLAILAVVALCAALAKVTRKPRWGNLGLGLGAGIMMHSGLDLVGWFNGIEPFWPFPYELNFWGWFSTPQWLGRLLDTSEFLGFALFLFLLCRISRQNGTDCDFEPRARRLAKVMVVVFVLLTALSILLKTGFLTVQGAFYLPSLGLTLWVVVRMKATIQAAPGERPQY